MIKILPVSVLVAMALLLPTTANAQEELTIGAIYLDAQGYYAGVRAGINDHANELGVPISVIETNARGDVSKESSFINTLTAAGVDALIISAVSSDGSVRAVEGAAKRGIPVVCYNTCVNEEVMKQSVYAYAVGDPFKFGEIIGKRTAEFIKENNIKNPKIGVINCEQYEVCVTRRKGFEVALNDAGIQGWEIVSNQEGAELDKAISTAEQILSSSPEVNILFGQAGGATLGAVKAVENAGRVGEVFVFGGDMTTEIAEVLKDNSILKGVVDISGKQMGALALDLALSAVEGKSTKKIIQAPIKIYSSQEDARSWLDTHPDGLP
ncbi:putative sugar transporter subunit: periplasmic-binding component of ABC superfamily [Vibrio nigripulchritudo SOn1]|uniref:Autoinducer 2-binding periplasmic protein LuxP n=1 Tax=Vibrio nigripulchritudo SOn1 TaxID=1238450 RepID=A0AAV2W0B4_9VIBR|nr:substrate-binding domain-containing protein [Vibrio nigripulchritudo]CCO50344.1 putative sugar transporter subunit: periplasmic-binding component of ABC superfamily [Vibrio nigripulchritudo SOn1]